MGPLQPHDAVIKRSREAIALMDERLRPASTSAHQAGKQCALCGGEGHTAPHCPWANCGCCGSCNGRAGCPSVAGCV
jgi:hypothetical protein